jgi:hypothetical protein
MYLCLTNVINLLHIHEPTNDVLLPVQKYCGNLQADNHYYCLPSYFQGFYASNIIGLAVRFKLMIFAKYSIPCSPTAPVSPTALFRYLLEVGSNRIAMEILLASHFKKMLNILRQAIVYAAAVLYD